MTYPEARRLCDRIRKTCFANARVPLAQPVNGYFVRANTKHKVFEWLSVAEWEEWLNKQQKVNEKEKTV